MSKKYIGIITVVVIIVAAVSFVGGIKYGQSATALAKLSQNQKQQLLGSLFGGNVGMGGVVGRIGTGNGGGARNVMGGNLTSGEILSKDDKSITIKTADGGSKIIFYSSSTSISKSDIGFIGDIVIGEPITVVGSTNSDGSISAQSIQMRPQVVRQDRN